MPNLQGGTNNLEFTVESLQSFSSCNNSENHPICKGSLVILWLWVKWLVSAANVGTLRDPKHVIYTTVNHNWCVM